MPETTDTQAMCCPVCRAGQDWSPTCRRCDADLSLLAAVAELQQNARRAALTALRQGDTALALRQARQAHRIQPDAASRRLLLASRMAASLAPPTGARDHRDPQ